MPDFECTAISDYALITYVNALLHFIMIIFYTQLATQLTEKSRKTKIIFNTCKIIINFGATLMCVYISTVANSPLLCNGGENVYIGAAMIFKRKILAAVKPT